MKQNFHVCFLILLLFHGASAAEPAGKLEEKMLREAATKALRIVEKSQRVWYEQGQTCASCHHQTLPILVASAARERGVKFDDKLAGKVVADTFAYLRDLDPIVQGHRYIDDIDEGWRLVAAREAGVPPSASTSAIAQFLAAAQRADGGWVTMDARPPQSHGRFTVTAVCAQGAAAYLPDQERKQSMLARARQWLLKAEPQSTEDRAYQLLGLKWTGADKEARVQKAKQLVAQQNKEDGGWSQLPGLGSDAYSTGEVLVALHQAGDVATSDAAYQRGLKFLLKNQQTDGSWRVESRLKKSLGVSPEFFEAGFPHGEDHQFISIMGTELATLALLQAVLPPVERPRLPGLPDFSPTERDAWVQLAVSGSVADLKKALDGNLKTSAKTKQGTTLLMLAAHDPRKVRLLLEGNADVHARSDSGLDALTVAARYGGNVESVRMLLKQEARPNAEKGVAVTNHASPFFFAAAVGDADTVRALSAAGAIPNHKMKVLGNIPTTPLMAATLRGDYSMAEVLFSSRVDLDSENDDPPLIRAVINNHAETVKFLLAKGAKVNLADSSGMTPLHYAATVHFGETKVLELLLAAGANPKQKNTNGRTALDLAKENKHKEVEAILMKSLAP